MPLLLKQFRHNTLAMKERDAVSINEKFEDFSVAVRLFLPAYESLETLAIVSKSKQSCSNARWTSMICSEDLRWINGASRLFEAILWQLAPAETCIL